MCPTLQMQALLEGAFRAPERVALVYLFFSLVSLAVLCNRHM